MYVGINRLVSAFKTKGDKKPYFINALIIIFLAVLMAVIPGMPLFVVGILITLYAITEIVGFVFGRKNKTETNTVTEAVIINEQIDTKTEDVKLLEKGE
jgi:type III secretory pathway component EscV